MTFRKKWKMEAGTQSVFVQRLRQYFFKELLNNEPEYIDDDWCRSNYKLFCPRVQFAFMNSCEYSLDGTSWKINIPLQHRSTQDALNAYIESKTMPLAIQNHIANCMNNNDREYTVIYLILRFPDTQSAHATFMIFDLKDKHQYYFDPEDSLGRNVCYTKAFSRKSFVNGFVPVSAEHLAEESDQNTLQRHFEVYNPDQTGTCGIIVALVLVCCLRFQYWDTKRMCRMIRQAANTPILKKELIRKFISWYVEIDEQDNYDADRIREKVLFCESQSKICGVFSKQSHNLCQRRPKKNNDRKYQYCWQHYEKLVNY